jgi:zinc protease
MLDNGINYFIWKNTGNKNKADFYIFYTTGSIHEKPDERGLAHLLEHVGFSPCYETENLLNYFRQNGMLNSANAGTNYYSTNFSLTNIPAGNSNLLDSVFKYLTFFPLKMQFNDDIIEKQKKIVLAEKLTDGCSVYDFQQSLAADFLPEIFSGSILGDTSVILSANASKLKDFYDRNYGINNMNIIATGDLDVSGIENLIIKYFNISNKQCEKNDFILPEFNITNRIIKTVADSTILNNILEIHFQMSAESSDPYVQLKEKYICGLIDKMLQKRLTEITYQLNAPFLQLTVCERIGFFFNAMNRNDYYIGVESNQDLLEAIEAVFLEIESIKRYGFTDEELENAKNGKFRWSMDYPEIDSNEYYVMMYYYLLTNILPFSMESYRNFESTALPKISLSEINDFFQNKIQASHPVIFLRYKALEQYLLPDNDIVEQILDSIGAAKISKYIFLPETTDLMRQKPKAGKIITENHDNLNNIYYLTLSNGAKLVFKQTENHDEKIQFYAKRNNPDLNLKDKYISTLMFRYFLAANMGVGNFAPSLLAKIYESKNMELFPYFNLNEQVIKGECFPSEIESLFQANYLFFTSPRFDNNILQNEIKRKKGSENMNFVLLDSINSMIYNDVFKEYMCEPVTIEKFRDIYRFIYARPADFTFYITGKIPVDSIKMLTKQYIASILLNKNEISKTNGSMAFSSVWWNVGRKSRTAISTINSYYATVYVACIGDYDKNIKSIMPVYREIITKLFMKKCNNVLREELKDVYSVRPFWAAEYDSSPYMLFSAYFRADPQKATALKDTTLKIMTDIFNGNFEISEFESVKQSVISKYIEQINSNKWLSTIYLPSCITGACFNPEDVEKIMVEDVKKVMQSIINQENIIDIVLLPANTKSQ